MPAKHTMHIAVDDPDDVIADLRTVFIRAHLEGVDLMTHPRRVFGRAPAPRLSRSALVRQAIKYGAEASRSASQQVAPALPEKAGAVDADRLRAAMGTMTPIECVRAAGLKDSASIRNVTNKGAALAGKLLAWVESREAEARK